MPGQSGHLRDPGMPLRRIAVYAAIRGFTRTLLHILYRPVVHGAENMPSHGPVLVVANHQSFLDPPFIGCSTGRRHLWFIARRGLFKARLFGWLISWLNSIPINEDGSDTRAIKAVLAQLADDRPVLIFPEGSRSFDGALQPFKRGAAVLVKRARCPVLPVAVEGCFDAWPRSRAVPIPFGRRLAIRIGAPISHEELMADGPDAALPRLVSEIDAMRLELREELRQRTRGRLPAAGPGDHAFSSGEPAQQSDPASAGESQTG